MVMVFSVFCCVLCVVLCARGGWLLGVRCWLNTCCAGLEELFFQLWFCVSFWFWQEIGFGLHTYVLRVQYSCGVVLVFWFWWEVVFGVTYVLSVQYSCAVVSVFSVVAGNRSQNENTFLQKKWVLNYDLLANVCIS